MSLKKALHDAGYSQNRYHYAAKQLQLWQDLAIFLFNSITHKACCLLLFQIQTPVGKGHLCSENFWGKPIKRQSKQQFQRLPLSQPPPTHYLKTYPSGQTLQDSFLTFYSNANGEKKNTSSSCSEGKISLNKTLKSMLNIPIRPC